MDCSELLELMNKLGDYRESIEYLASIIVYRLHGCMGRHFLMNKLGISERRARRIIDDLRRIGVLVRRGYDNCLSNYWFNKLDLNIYFDKHGEYIVEFIEGFKHSILDLVDANIIYLRDYIVVSQGDPDCLEVIGYYDRSKNSYFFPRVPKPYIDKYLEIVKKHGIGGDAVVVVWRKHKPYYSAASILYGIARLCLDAI